MSLEVELGSTYNPDGTIEGNWTFCTICKNWVNHLEQKQHRTTCNYQKRGLEYIKKYRNDTRREN